MKYRVFFTQFFFAGICFAFTTTAGVRTGYILSDQIIQQDSLPSIKNDFMVNTLAGPSGAKQNYPSIAKDSSGNYLVAWIDSREGNNNVYAQMFDHNDQKVGANFKVNSLSYYTTHVVATANKRGDFAIVWRSSYDSLSVQRINKNGNKTGEKRNIYASNSYAPSFYAAMNNDAKLLVGYLSTSNYNQILGTIIDSNNQFLYSSIPISDSLYSPYEFGQTKCIDVDASGNYTVVWSSYTGSSFSKIYAQTLNQSGSKIGRSFLISSDTTNEYHYPEGVSITENGYKLVYYKGSYGLYYRLLTPDNKFIGSEFRIDTNYYYVEFSVSTNKKNEFAIFWRRETPRFRMIDTLGNIILDSVVVNYGDPLNKDKTYHSLSDIFNNQFHLVFISGSMFDADCAIQKFDTNFNAIGQYTIVNDDSLDSNQSLSIGKFNNRGGAIVVWNDERNGRDELFAAALDSNFNKIGADVKVNDFDTGYWPFTEKVISTFSDGTFALAFHGYDVTSNRTRFNVQLIDVNGVKIGSNIKIDSAYSGSMSIAMNVNENDEVLISLYDRSGMTIYKFTRNFDLLYKKIIMSPANSIGFSPITCFIDDKLDIFVVWKDYNFNTGENGKKIYGAYYNSVGTPISPKSVIDSTTSYVYSLKCISQERNYLVAIDRGYELRIVTRYSDLGESKVMEFPITPTSSKTDYNLINFASRKFLLTFKLGNNIFLYLSNDNKREYSKVVVASYTNPYFTNNYTIKPISSADYFNGKFLITYHDAKANTGFDVYASVKKIDNFDFNDETFYPLEKGDHLYNNFPNPFNAKTKIAYQILSYGKVKLTVYDILGREVIVLVDSKQDAGIYEVDFNASSLPSGVYFYKLDAFNITVKKMLIIK